MEAYIGTCVWGMWRHTLGMNARIMKQAKRRACSARKMTAITCCPLPAHAIMLHACYTPVTRLYKSTRTLCTMAQLHSAEITEHTTNRYVRIIIVIVTTIMMTEFRAEVVLTCQMMVGPAERWC